MNPEASTEQSIQALQAQNAQFQELIKSLAQGQQDLKTLLLKKKKKWTVLFNPRRKSGHGSQNEAELTTPSVGKDSPHEREVPSPVVSDNETDFNDEQYPPAEDRYKQLEDCLNAMEIQRVPGLDLKRWVWFLGLLSCISLRFQYFLSTVGSHVPRCISDGM